MGWAIPVTCAPVAGGSQTSASVGSPASACVKAISAAEERGMAERSVALFMQGGDIDAAARAFS